MHGAVTSGSGYRVPSGAEPPASVFLVVAPADLRLSGWRRAVRGLVFAGGMGVDVPGSLPVGAVAHGSVHVHSLSCRDYLAPGVTVGTFGTENDK